jgi:2-dehydro-3-deoxyphosphooctonate aldolase (KDO 8-P synthase)
VQLTGHEVGAGRPLFLIAGPCVIEGAALTQEIAGRLKEITTRLGIPFIFKASYDKANRSSRASFRGLGLEAGLKVLDDVRRVVGVPVLTDVHEDSPLAEVAAVVDVLQTPAFLCRQTNFIINAASQGKPVNIKKGQFLSPWEMQNVVDKARSTGNEAILVCERGFSFGYNNLVSDMRSLSILRATGCPVVFDATHSVQLPGGQGSASGGRRRGGGAVHGDASEPGEGAVGWSERLAAAAHGAAPRHPVRARPGGEESTLRGVAAVRKSGR